MTEPFDPEHYGTLPGGCVVKQLAYRKQAITLKPRLLSPFGFTPEQPTMVLMMPGYLVITTQPQHQAVLKGIGELQLRQDEMKQDFTEAILALRTRFTG